MESESGKKTNHHHNSSHCHAVKEGMEKLNQKAAKKMESKSKNKPQQIRGEERLSKMWKVKVILNPKPPSISINTHPTALQ